LVASTTERDVKGGDKKDVGTNTPAPGVKSDASSKRRSSSKRSSARDDGQVSNVLRSVYQCTVEEEIPSEMLDLLRKLD
jgi:Anti-sigma factor NepR